MADNLYHLHVPTSSSSWSLNLPDPQGLSRAVQGQLHLLHNQVLGAQRSTTVLLNVDRPFVQGGYSEADHTAPTSTTYVWRCTSIAFVAQCLIT